MWEHMKMNKAAAFSLIFLSFTGIIIANLQPSNASSKTIIVPDEYSTITSAIGNATDGDTVFVRIGTYEMPLNETLTISKTISLIGEDAGLTKLKLHAPYGTAYIPPDTWLSGFGNPLEVYADEVLIKGFTITNSDGGSIRVNGKNTQISDNVIEANLDLQGTNQTFCRNRLSAALTCSGCYSTIYGNEVNNGSMTTLSGSYCSIFSNYFFGGGIGVGGTSCYELIYNNTIDDGTCIGIASTENVVAKNTITNSYGGVCISWGGNNKVVGNCIKSCRGVGLEKTENSDYRNSFYANQVENCSFGAKIATRKNSEETIFYQNNFVRNHQQVSTETDSGLFDNGNKGNFWSDYIGSDANGDGIGDNPYTIDVKRKDNYPLIEPYNISALSLDLPDWASPTIIETEYFIPFSVPLKTAPTQTPASTFTPTESKTAVPAPTETSTPTTPPITPKPTNVQSPQPTPTIPESVPTWLYITISALAAIIVALLCVVALLLRRKP
jgi:hypothetical protein